MTQPVRGTGVASTHGDAGLESLSEVAAKLIAQHDFSQLLVDIADHASGLFPSHHVVVYSNVDRNFTAAVDRRPQQLRSRLAIEHARLCVSRLVPVVQGDDNDPTTRSLSVPLVASQNRVLAVLQIVAPDDAGGFGDADVQLSEALARVATIAVDRACLFFRINEWRNSVESLLLFNATVNQQLKPERMVRELVTEVTGFLDAQGGMAGVFAGDGADAALQCDGFYYGDLWADFSREWRAGEGIPGAVMETQFPYLCEDYSADAQRELDLAGGFDLGPCVCVPIKNPREEVLGFFQLHRPHGAEPFTWQDAAFLESLGNTAAVAIENARLMESLELKTRQIESLSRDNVRRLEEERSHIARELHDGVGQVLVGLNLRLQMIGALLTPEQKLARDELGELRRHVSAAAGDLRDMAKRLRPPTLDELGFEASLQGLVADFRAHADFSIDLTLDAKPELTAEQQTALYRVVQECLTNVVKHASATEVQVWFGRSEGRQALRVTDDGEGFSPTDASEGLGHIGIAERMTMLGGSVRINSVPGQGTTVEAILQGGDPNER
ncbi:MAG: GAF domain-containing protein [Planctomycetota bacterium]